MEVEVREPARQAIQEALAAEALERAVLVVLPDDSDECCTFGFDVLLVPRHELPAENYQSLGEHPD